MTLKETHQLSCLISIVTEIIATKLLWNYFMPMFFHLPTINYFQSFLLCFFSSMLFTNITQTRKQEYIAEMLEKLLEEKGIE